MNSKSVELNSKIVKILPSFPIGNRSYVGPKKIGDIIIILYENINK